MRCLFVSLLALLLLATSCVSRQRHNELQETLNYYKAQALEADSVTFANTRLVGETGDLDAEIRQLTMEVERLTATNLSLNRNYESLLQRYNGLLEQNKDVLDVSGYEMTNLQQNLARCEADLAAHRREIDRLLIELRERDDQLQRLQGGVAGMNEAVASRDMRIQELQQRLNSSTRRLDDLRLNLNEALYGFTANDLSFADRDGRLYLSLSDVLLFPKGSDQIDARGLQALRQAAGVLQRYPDIQVMVEGHTDSDGNAALNWNLSTERALAVLQALIGYGVDPSRIVAAGRAFYDPVAPNDSPRNKALNRRTEIILAPDYDEMYRLLRQ